MSSPANPGEAPFASSLDHLLAEGERVRALLAIAVTHAQQAPSEDDERPTELDALLLAPLGTPSWAAGPASLPAELLELPERVAETITARRGAAPSRLDALCERCRLTPLDRDLLMIAVAPELDRRIARLYGFLRGLDHEAPATVDVALGLLSATFAARDAAQARLASDAPLVGLGLVEQTDHPAPPQRLEHTLVISRRALAFLRGFDGAPPLTGLLRAVAPGDHSLADAGVADADIATIERLAAEGGRSLLVHGPDAAARRLVAEALARRRGRALLVADALALTQLPSAELATILRDIAREAALTHADLLWEGFEALVEEERAPLRRRVLAAASVCPNVQVVLSSAIGWEPAPGDAVARLYRVGLERLTVDEQRAVWRRLLGARVDPSLPDGLARAFRLGAGPIHAAVATARERAAARDPAAPAPTREELFEAARLHSRRGLDDLARRIEVCQGWDDLILPSDRKAALAELCDRVRLQHRVLTEWGMGGRMSGGRGQTALLHGPPGTGKTMAAGIIAAELGLPCYAIDLATIVSKYVGETEKNLARVFAAAEETGAVLVFDEADALFGKRTKIRDAHDRHANIEVSYLLQRIDQYDGVVMLTSNLRKNIDEAFIRRMHFIIDFPLPGAPERAQIWRRVFPSAAPREPLDFDWLGERFKLAGGHIINIAVAATYRAAAEDAPIAMRHIVAAARREYQNLGGMVSTGFFAAPSTDVDDD